MLFVVKAHTTANVSGKRGTFDEVHTSQAGTQYSSAAMRCLHIQTVRPPNRCQPMPYVPMTDLSKSVLCGGCCIMLETC